MRYESELEKTAWTLDRRVPIAVVIALAIQLASALIWATQLSARVNMLEQNNVSNVVVTDKFSRLEERMENVKQNVESIRRQIDVLTDRLLKK